MLGLKLPTDPRWVDLANMSLEDILTDHAYCEQKAATYCISLIQFFYDKEELIKQLSPIVTEEWGHFRLVLQEMEKRNIKLGKQRKDEYVLLLHDFILKGGSREDHLLEKLLVCALIEARSCERFRLLSLDIADDNLKEFYHKFMVSEAGHYRLFIDLAKKYAGEEKAKKRWQEFLDYEAEIMKKLALRGDRIH
ncbi:MAG: tRNA-(ms[2]io[6]A)-hydroxylase [Saprospiraceae bacterium]|jgi:tRNA-(ms[2]io[6]A)-hydroxylase|nr:tRNA-(ms[2]io[6]A)-hydroxylase [Saprospiraceae bacterium]